MGLLTKAVRELLETPEFKQWFGRSKMINEDGSPMKLFHATAKDFDAFKPGGYDPELSGRAIWLGDDPSWLPAAHNVGARDGFKEGTQTIPVHVRMEKPLWIDEPGMLEWARAVYGKNLPYLMPDDVVKNIREDGYDGVRVSPDAFKSSRPGDGEYIVFEPEQIKSAISNTGEFSLKDPRIIAGILGAAGISSLDLDDEDWGLA